MGIKEIKIIELFLKNYQITVYNVDSTLTKTPFFIGNSNNKFLYLFLYNEHYYVIRSMTGFLNKSYYCDYCKVGYDNVGGHFCEFSCKSCHRRECEREFSNTLCIHCNIQCRNNECLQIHEKHICKLTVTCQICGGIKKNKHVCNENNKWCTFCNKEVSLDHQCFIQIEKEIQSNFKSIIFFDYECYVDEENKHIPMFAYAIKVCFDCMYKNSSCIKCQEKAFRSSDDFCEWIFQQENSIAVAHNLKGYDGCFILQYILKNINPNDKLPKVVCVGTKILSITFKKVKFIDSYSFISCKLENFPKTFDIKELKKGFFPHTFNKPENFNYVGEYPDKKFYCTEFFSESKKREFDYWYESVKHTTFNFDQELTEYCKSDVLLLKEGCIKFAHIIKEITHNWKGFINPFTNSLTAPSMCHVLYRRDLMPKESIGIIPEINTRRLTSSKCVSWLKHVAETENIQIQHALNRGEFKVGNYFVDGICFDNNTIYEFHGCLYHGCQKCYQSNTFIPMLQKTTNEIYYHHSKRLDKIRDLMPDYTIIEMWECDWNKQSIKVNEPLKPRDALFGGRTNAIKLFYECNTNEKIKYYDYTSLYPYVQKYCRFPIGHPTIITENFQDVRNYFGLIKCTILPPKDLYIPVLPARINNKLVFTLCSKCPLENKSKCNHCDKDRCLTGTWITLEVQRALEKKYTLISIEEVWHWSETSVYDKSTKSGGLFTKYVNKFLKLKQEASGFPKDCIDKQAYIDKYYEKEGIKLDFDKINKNSGLRNVMKIMLNSHWGRFGMNCNKVQYKLISDTNEWFKMLNNDQFKIHSVDFSHDNILQVFYSIDKDQFEGGKQTSVPLAAFVTCHARLKLYDELEKLNERVLYFDTDSIFFISRPNEYEPELGDYLGEFTNEIDQSEGNYIQSFVSAGPKNYSYLTDTGIQHSVVKGFSLTSTKTLNFDIMKDIVCNDRNRKVALDQLMFTRNKVTWDIQSNYLSKMYQFVYTKRVLVDNFDTIPFGYDQSVVARP